MKWEYHTDGFYEDVSIATNQAYLDRRGRERRELVSTYVTLGSIRYVFKRPLIGEVINVS